MKTGGRPACLEVTEQDGSVSGGARGSRCHAPSQEAIRAGAFQSLRWLLTRQAGDEVQSGGRERRKGSGSGRG